MTTIAGSDVQTGRPRLGQSDWILWNQSLVRSAGFPLEEVSKFCDQDLAQSADALNADKRDFDPEKCEPFASYWHAHSQARSSAVVHIAGHSLFRLAVTWQNRHFIDSGLDPLLHQIAAGQPRTHKRRAREQTVASYWQRYCAKCESIGFFGPVAWADVGADGPALAADHGPALVAESNVFLEGWPVAELAKTLARQIDLRPWIAPRRAPYVRVRDGQVTLPNGRTEPVTALATACLARADGKTFLPDLIRAVACACPQAPSAEIYQQLTALHERGWLIWRFELSPAENPERELRSLLVRCGAPEAGAALAALDRLITARDQAARVWDQSARLGLALSELDAGFTDATGMPGRRSAGLAYAGRTLAYLDCRRDLAVSIGSRLVSEMEPLGLVLDSVRWMLARVRDGLLELVRQAYHRLAGQDAHAPDAARLWLECLPFLGGTLQRIVEQAAADTQLRWQSILDIADGCSRATFRADDLRDDVRAQFGDSSPGWTDARWCSPDVMIAASSQAAIQAGDYLLVLGEIHSALNTVDFSSMVGLNPRPATLMACLDQDQPGPRLLVALPREARPKLTARSHPALIRDHDYRLLLTPHAPVPARGIICAGADADVIEENSRLLLVMPDGTRFDVMDMFAEPLKGAVAQSFDLYPVPGHRPRVTIDRVVVARERWTFPAHELSFASLPTEAKRFVSARHWLAGHGLPGQVFVKSPAEVKPFYVDFSAPAYVELLATAVRRLERHEPTAGISLVEMLPGHAGTWLRDARGRRYVAELRLVAFDSRNRSAGRQPPAGNMEQHARSTR